MADRLDIINVFPQRILIKSSFLFIEGIASNHRILVTLCRDHIREIEKDIRCKIEGDR